MFRNLTNQGIRRAAMQAAFGEFRGLGAPSSSTYTVPENSEWIGDKKVVVRWLDKQEANRKERSPVEYVRSKAGSNSGLGWNGLVSLFGPLPIRVIVDGTGKDAFYLGDNTMFPLDFQKSLRETGLWIPTPSGAKWVGPWLYTSAGPNNQPSVVADALAATEARSLADWNGGYRGQCQPYGEITKTMAAVLLSVGEGKYRSDCLEVIANMKSPDPSLAKRFQKEVGQRSESNVCAPGYYQMIAGRTGCKPGQTWQTDPSNPRCGKCMGTEKPTCPDGYYPDRPSTCGQGYRVEAHPKVSGCWACLPGCPGGYVPPDQANCAPDQEAKLDTYYNTGCVICTPKAPVCPPGYYVLPPGAPFTCPPWQQRKVDQATGCVACETASNCFPTASGLSCGPGQTPRNYGEFTCCQSSASAPPPSSAPPTTDPAIGPTTPPPGSSDSGGVMKAGLGLGGGVAIAAVAAGILYAVFGKGAADASAAAAPRQQPGSLGGAARLRGRP